MADTGNSSASKSLMWMMTALFTGVAILLGAGVFFAGRVLRAMGSSAMVSKDTIRTPMGSFRLEKEKQIGPGLPLYPHAALVMPDTQNVGETVKEAESGRNTVTYHTDDTRETVDSWYKEHLGPEFTRHDAGEKPSPEIYRDARVSEDDIAFVAERELQVRMIALSLDETGTKIALIRIDKPTAPQ